ncbi:MAG: hypothetical protein K9W44_08160 [Candidatus Lokiarchaeota archaeon]|nr:hypothetical protein [Candidatus Harpocratesius repetitus]
MELNSKKTAFIRYMTSGDKPIFRNEQDYPLEDLIHPLIYNDLTSNKGNLLKIPMAYHFQRQFTAFVKSLLQD